MSTDRFAQADAAFKAGQAERGIELTEAILEADGAAPNGVYRNFCGLLFRRGLFAQTQRWASIGVAQYPRDPDLWNMLGVACRRLGRPEEALAALSKAEKLAPKNTAILSNKGNVHNDMRNGPAAVETFTKLVRLAPGTAEFQRGLARAHWFSGDLGKAVMRLNLAIKLKPDLVDGWLDLVSVASEQDGPLEAMPVVDRAIAAMPGEARLREARASLLRRAGRLREAEAYLGELLAELGDLAWIHGQLGGVLADYDRARANMHLEKAAELEPASLERKMALAESLGRSRYGDESEHLERAYGILRETVGPGQALSPSQLKVAMEVVVRLADYDLVESLGSFKEIGDAWADSGRHTALLIHLGRVRTDQDRLDLVDMHRRWGASVEANAAKWPVRRPPSRPANGKIRLGFMSSDLRGHPVAYFAMPLFEHYDRERFEVYCYSFFQGDKADGTQAYITSQVDGFRWRPDIADREAAQLIADDQLDMLFELGGSTHMNKIEVMAYKPARLSASWLGYPHSAGLSTIDYLMVDPYLNPPAPGLLIEEPLIMPSSWIALGRLAFPETHVVNPLAPVGRNGFITFGTANNPYKYSPEMLRVWARVVASVPGSRFLFVRPEGGSEAFRRNIRAVFAAEGVGGERVLFNAVRGAHMPVYNEIDIALDTLPQTGGTTTCEAAWMGVPTVTQVGEAVFERLSYSILTNAGLGDLCVATPDDFIAAAVKLAADTGRIQALRIGLRQQLKASPLGRTEQFARDFYDLIARTVESRLGARRSA